MNFVRDLQTKLFLLVLCVTGCQSTTHVLPAEVPPPTKFAVAISPTDTLTLLSARTIPPTLPLTASATPIRNTGAPVRTRTLPANPITTIATDSPMSLVLSPSATRSPTIVLATKSPTVVPPTGTRKPSPTSTPAPTIAQPAVTSNLPNVTYSLLSANSSTAPHLPANVDLNVRGFVAVNARADLVDYAGQFDAAAPAMYRMFSDNRTPTISATYQIYNWDDACNCRGTLNDDWEVTLTSLATIPGEVLSVPDSGYDIGSGYEVLVVYADANRIVFTYTRDDSPFRGYVVYLDGISVEANLVALYQQADRAGRGSVPALRAGQAFARAPGAEMKFAMRDAGAFMDPRSRKDWWRR